MTENINHPSHYNHGKIETIEYLEDNLGPDGFESFCIGNALKYISRYKYKGGYEDLKKAIWYLNRLIQAAERSANQNDA